MAATWWRRTLRSRLTLVVVMALVLWTAVTAIAIHVASRRAAETIVMQWSGTGRHIAGRVEAELEGELRRLDAIAAVLEIGGDPERLGAAVRDLQLAESALRVSAGGDVLWARSTATGAERPPALERLSAMRGEWRGHPTDVLMTRDGARVLLLWPARESDPAGGAIAAVLAPQQSALDRTLASYQTDAYSVDLIDAAGARIAGVPPDGAEPDALAAVIAVPRSSWSVRLSQPRREALAPLDDLRTLLVGGSVVLMTAALLMAWGVARSIRVPVERLTRAAERLTHGELETPIAAAGDDEIGRLGHALESLRQALQRDERRSLLLRRVLSVQEDERRRIARELHDQTTQQLTALGLQLETAGRGAVSPDLAGARNLVGRMIDDLHRLIYDLRPSILDDLGLFAAIQWFANTHLSARGVDVHVEVPADAPAFDPAAATAIYRVVQEALTNVARHAHAEAVQVACSLSSSTLTIEVEDDGRGFDPGALARPRLSGEGLGLLGMRERLALVGGRLEIDSAPGSGTRVIIEAPLSVLAAGSRESLA